MATLITASVLAGISLSGIQSVLIVALGLGLVIFFHELGHFAVAKWCNVNVERFSIGFGPILLSWKWGETEYALSIIPFGGYVKMLGQDDADPGQMVDSEIEQDPRSYIAKNVPQRMAIISAGVIMNVITGLLFFAIAFRLGLEMPPATLGSVTVGKPAWKAGLRNGDQITKINGRETAIFKDIMMATALSSSEYLEVEGIRSDGKTPFNAKVYPEMLNKSRRIIGISPTNSLELYSQEVLDINGFKKVTAEGSPADKAEPSFEPSDKVVALNGEAVSRFSDLETKLAQLRSEEVTFTVERASKDKDTPPKKVDIKVGTNTFRTLGLWMDIGQLEDVLEGSPAEKAGMLKGDKVVRIEELDVGKDLNPLTIPEFMANRHGQPVKVVVTREESGSGAKEHELTITPLDRPGWVERPVDRNVPLSVPSIGVSFHLTPTVLKVEEGCEAEGKISPGDRIEKLEFFIPEGEEKDRYSGHKKETENMTFTFGGDEHNWATAFWSMQGLTKRHVRLTIKSSSEDEEPRTVELKPYRAENWYLPTRGFMVSRLRIEQKADTMPQAFSMGLHHTQNNILDIYMTLRNLFTGNLSVKELHGPLGIASVAYQVARQGLADFSQFLGFLSINLAVLNFLPIPVLDGGHMVFLMWEGITRKKPSEKVLIIATYIGMLFVLGLMMLVIYLDIFEHKIFS